VRADDSPLPLTAAKQKAILALLLLHRDEVVSVDRLKEVLWEDAPPATAGTALQGYVSQLRRLLDSGATEGASLLVTRPPGYTLAASPQQVDLTRFEQLANEGRDALAAAESERAAALLAEALGLWRGPPLADFSYEGWAQGPIGRLEELRLAALEDRIEADLACGRHGELVGELESLIAENPLRERLRGQLMLALYRGGRQADALEAYQAARRTLVDELGIEPGPELQELNRLILKQDEALAAPAREATATTASQLPIPPTPIIGRQDELAALKDLLAREDVRLLTLTGPGGTGKTRLALEVAALVSGDYNEGAFWVDLAPLQSADLVTATIGQVLGVKGDLATQLSGKQALLVLDNLEHLLECASELASLLSGSPALKLLVTSREPLRLSAEHEYPVAPLDEGDAIALFAERARQHKPDFEVVEAVTEISRRLDGLPLALELAAARAKVLAPEEILKRLDESLNFLTAGPRDAPERQRTLRATIEWSYDLLGQDEQQLFARLAVFAGDFDLDAAEAVCDAEVDSLAALIDKSLLRRTVEGRFFILETIREYAVQRLQESGEADELRTRHARLYSGFVCELVPRWIDVAGSPAERSVARDRLHAEMDNSRAALLWLFETGELEDAGRLTAELGQFWAAYGNVGEARAWVDRMLDAGKNLPDLERARLLIRRGYHENLEGAPHESRATLMEALRLSRAGGARRETAKALLNLGYLAVVSGEYPDAAPYLEEAILLYEEEGDPGGVDTARGLHAYALGALGDFERAIPMAEESVAFARGSGALPEEVSMAVANLGEIMFMAQDYVRAEALLREAMAAPVNAAFKTQTLVTLGIVTSHRKRPVRAARLLGAADRLYDEFGDGVATDHILREHAVSSLKATLGNRRFSAAWESGRSMSLEEAFNYALADAD
jgi:predicted ATPase/DNA-binding SARP family transcriptional activator